MLVRFDEYRYKDGVFEFNSINRMSDEPVEPNAFLKERLDEILIVLDRHELHLAAAWVEQAIAAIPVCNEN